jgi:hypothetical protein
MDAHLASTASQQVNLSATNTKYVVQRMSNNDITPDLFDKAAREITLMLQNE